MYFGLYVMSLGSSCSKLTTQVINETIVSPALAERDKGITLTVP